MGPDRSVQAAPSSCEGCGASLHYPREPTRVMCDTCMSDDSLKGGQGWGSSAWVARNAMKSDTLEEPPPGWYADPTYRGQVRRWDGNAWTDQRRLTGTHRSPSALQLWEDQVRGKIENDGYLRTVGAGMWWVLKGIAFVIYCLVLFVVLYWFVST